jgi:hypothetical protein
MAASIFTFSMTRTHRPRLQAHLPRFFQGQGGACPPNCGQVRYPKDLFDIQMQIYAKYHQTDPACLLPAGGPVDLCRNARRRHPGSAQALLPDTRSDRSRPPRFHAAAAHVSQGARQPAFHGRGRVRPAQLRQNHCLRFPQRRAVPRPGPDRCPDQPGPRHLPAIFLWTRPDRRWCAAP